MFFFINKWKNIKKIKKISWSEKINFLQILTNFDKSLHECTGKLGRIVNEVKQW